MKTSELSGVALDWAVAKAEGIDGPSFVYQGELYLGKNFDDEGVRYYGPSTDWAQGGPIIERVGMHLIYLGFGGEEEWEAYILSDSKFTGPTPLIAAMRCYVASKLGDEVEVP